VLAMTHLLKTKSLPISGGFALLSFSR